MKFRKLSALLLTLVLVLSLAAGCAGDGDESGNKAGSDSGGSSGGEKVKITFWKWIPTEGQMPDLEKAFEAKYPDIDLVATHIGNSEAYFQKLAAGLAGGEGPDVVAMQVGANANQYKEFLEPLEPYAVKAWGANWKTKFLDVALEQSAYSGDEYVVLPGGMTATPVILFNQSIFAKHGIKPPKTMQELKDIILTLKEKEPGVIPGVGIGAKDGWTDRDVFMGIVNQIAPGKVYKAQAGELAWTDPDIVKAFEVWGNLFKDKIYMEGALGQSPYPDVFDQFLKGKLAMFSIGTWHLSGQTQRAKDNAGKDYVPQGMFPYPPVQEGATPYMVATVDIAWGMNKDTKHKDAVWKFIEFMTAGEGQEIWTNTLQVLPSAKGIEVSKDLMAGESEKQSLETTLDFMNTKIAGARELIYPELQNALFDALQAVAAGGKSPKEVAEDLEKVSKTLSR
jgi:raffinose/stachyose/melibiose transport system substrate-binding protein